MLMLAAPVSLHEWLFTWICAITITREDKDPAPQNFKNQRNLRGSRELAVVFHLKVKERENWKKTQGRNQS